MIYPKNIEYKLEFDQVKQLLESKCISEQGLEYVGKMRFSGRFDHVEKMLIQVKELLKILTEDAPFPSENYFNISPFIRKASIEGAFLSEEEFHQLRLMLNTFGNICTYFETRLDRYPNLYSVFEGIKFNHSFSKSIAKIMDDEGKMRPNASPELAKISSKIGDKEKEVRTRINRIFTNAAENGWLGDTGISVRDGRLVLPVLAEFKRNITGLVHDESATGQTVFIEPSEIFELNNIIRELNIAHRRERERILTELTYSLRPHLEELETYHQRLGLIDFIRAKASLAIDIGADIPVLLKSSRTKLCEAFHPLLKLSHAKTGGSVVPLNIEITPEKRIIVISGPNAGGKSVCLKTVGLLQYMLQCGLLIPVKSHSECGIYSDIMVDIGDEQSIENDLSTYSSHLLHMKNFTEFSNSKTLFLIDEFGTGTDPQFGGPLAEAILDKLNKNKSFGVVTTHYSNLKNFASETPGLQNACMLFDHDRMQATYILEQGKPGSSYAFEIAAKTGLPEDIIELAKLKVGGKQQKVDDLLIDLEKEKYRLRELTKRFEQKEIQQKKLVEDYTTLKDEIDSSKRKILKDAKQEALAIITEANSRIENTIRELREKKADDETMRSVRKDLKETTQQLRNEVRENVPGQHVLISPSKSINDSQELRVGSTVKLRGQDTTGQITELKKQKALVTLGGMSSWIDLDKLEHAVGAKKEAPKKESMKGIDFNDRMQHFHTDLNIIGMRGEEAMSDLKRYLDDAFLLGFKQVRIVHGRGYGILRKLVREQLKLHPKVEQFAEEHIDHGGDAVTVVSLKN